MLGRKARDQIALPSKTPIAKETKVGVVLLYIYTQNIHKHTNDPAHEEHI